MTRDEAYQQWNARLSELAAVHRQGIRDADALLVEQLKRLQDREQNEMGSVRAVASLMVGAVNIRPPGDHSDY